ncbi:MAG: cupin domain-containing protein [Deltaproteobacteria bacterium HGW-Deltaproteobacteria-14]|nr:MAG: cupin domain-containing protein [Deltaproteobacteria bacterium HGW-Deltaproteobacteria-14]PKQ17668.1 MAG: cupin domain-containing protein [Actinobacteria bacterium HGW-Actinobacteria-8]
MPVLRAPSTPTHTAGGNRFTALANPSNGSHQTSLWRVVIPEGDRSPVHQLTREEVLLILAGSAEVQLEGDHTVGPGDVIVVPAHVDFAIAATSDVEALCCLPVGGQAVVPGGPPFTPPWAQ